MFQRGPQVIDEIRKTATIKDPHQNRQRRESNIRLMHGTNGFKATIEKNSHGEYEIYIYLHVPANARLEDLSGISGFGPYKVGYNTLVTDEKLIDRELCRILSRTIDSLLKEHSSNE